MAHPQWRDPPNQNPTLYHVWDFVMRSLYMLSEYDNIKAGRPLEHPEQFQGGAGKYSLTRCNCSHAISFDRALFEPPLIALIDIYFTASYYYGINLPLYRVPDRL
jgi:hypothetical protein